MPPPRDYYGEMKGAMDAQYRLAPEMIAKERELVPQWQQLQMEQMTAGANNLKTFYGNVMGDSANLMRQYGSTFTDALSPIARGARSTYEQGLGGGERLQNTMRGQAESELSYGMGLTPEMERESAQRARAGMTARGLTNTNRGIGAEILGGYKMGMDRQDRARTFAGTVLSNDVTMGNNAYQQYGSPLITSGLQSFSPMGLAQGATAGMQNLGPSYLQPESQYSANLYSANQNMAIQKAVADAQAKNALTSGLISGAAAIATGGVSEGGRWACWVAREVYGKENPKWLLFREWLETTAPKWFHKLYLEEGERFAEYIKDKPLLKDVIRFGMDCVINFNYNSNTIKA